MDPLKGKIYSLNISKHKGVAKKPVDLLTLLEGIGVENDAHAKPEDDTRQVSLLAIESIYKQQNCPKTKKAGVDLVPGDFGENITTEGLDLSSVKIGDRFEIDDSVIEISRIGKECHRYCSIYYKTGDCIMPKEGIFARVLEGGVIKTGSEIIKI